ncbi:MAG: SCO family protein [Halopseudomonas sp.]
MSRHVLFLITALFLNGVVNADTTITGEFNLTDHRGNQVNQESYQGKLRLVFFGYTQCPVVCPTTLLEVVQVIRQLGNDSLQVQPLFITIDPQNDSVENLATYVAAFHPSIVGLTGSAQQIADAAKAFKASYGFIKNEENPKVGDEVYHSAYLYLMDRSGQFIDLFGYSTKPEKIVDTIRQYL